MCVCICISLLSLCIVTSQEVFYVPTVPTVPIIPTVPTVPTEPTVPSEPAVPIVSTAPTVPTVPNVPIWITNLTIPTDPLTCFGQLQNTHSKLYPDWWDGIRRLRHTTMTLKALLQSDAWKLSKLYNAIHNDEASPASARRYFLFKN